MRSYDNVIKQVDSFGRRRRRRRSVSGSGSGKPVEEDLVVMQTIKIMDTFHLNDTRKKGGQPQTPHSFVDDLKCELRVVNIHRRLPVFLAPLQRVI